MLGGEMKFYKEGMAYAKMQGAHIWGMVSSLVNSLYLVGVRLDMISFRDWEDQFGMRFRTS
jgi:hypothetical protein